MASKRLSQIKTATVAGLSVLGAASLYTARNEYNRAQQYLDRLRELEGKPLSGVRVCERPPRFRLLFWFNHLVPFHQSLLIPPDLHQNSSLRHVGLGNALNGKWRNCQWRTHPDMSTVTFPVEAWGDFKEAFGYFPQIDDKSLVLLNELTVTAEELQALGRDPDSGLCPRFMSLVSWAPPRFFHCRWAILDAVHRATQQQQQQQQPTTGEQAKRMMLDRKDSSSNNSNSNSDRNRSGSSGTSGSSK